MSDTVPQLMTLVAVAKVLSVSPFTVRSWVRQGKLKPLRICRRLLFHPGEVNRLLQQSRADSKTSGSVE
jgi:excisionase family DNA binding protein